MRLEPYPPNIEPYPPCGSHAEKLGLQVFDLITPDGSRVWVIAGWNDKSELRCWTIEDFVKDRHPSKVRQDAADQYAPLLHINSCSDLREQFVSDYLAANKRVGEQKFLFGLRVPRSFTDWRDNKIAPYGPSGQEHIIRDCDPYSRILIVDPVRAGNREHYLGVDIWEVTASWHQIGERIKQKPKPPPEDGPCLYRLYDRSGQLLYVGVTNNLFRRWKQHSQDKAWWPAVHKFTQDWYPDRQSVEEAERRAIKSERPIHNVIHRLGD